MPVSGDIGLPNKRDRFRGEQLVLEPLTADPADHQEGDAWLRIDLAPATNQIATLRFDNGSGIDDIPIFEEGTASGGVEEVFRPFDSVQGYVPILPSSESPAFDQLGFQHASTRYGLHNSTKRVFSPDDIASLAHWYDATAITGLSDGNAVSTWTDEEGTDDLSQGTGSKQPTYQTNVIGSNPVVRFDGSDDFLGGAFASSIGQPHHVFIAARWRTLPSGTNAYQFDGDTNENLISVQNSSGQNDWGYRAGGSFVESGTADTNVSIFTVLFNGASSYMRVDSTQVASGDAGSNALDGITLGATRADTGHAAVDIGEVLAYDAALSSSDESYVEAYLSGRW